MRADFYLFTLLLCKENGVVIVRGSERVKAFTVKRSLPFGSEESLILRHLHLQKPVENCRKRVVNSHRDLRCKLNSPSFFSSPFFSIQFQ